MEPPAPRAADIAGVPRIPPGSAAVAITRVRHGLTRLRCALAPPPLLILEGALALLDHQVLVALCRAGVPEALDRRQTTAALAARVGADPDRLERLLRLAATRGWVRLDRRGRASPTRVTAFLRPDHPGGWRAWVDLAGREEVRAAVAATGVDGADPFAAAHGSPFFRWAEHHEDLAATFDQAMAAGGRLHALALRQALDWSGVTHVCDVGGGTGALLRTLLDLQPDLEGTLVDLASVVARAPSHPRMEVVAGDAFASVPAGADLYLLVNVVHDWADADATRILATVAEAARPGVRVVVVEADRPLRPRADVATSSDVLMAALTPGGRERDRASVAHLARSAGLRCDGAIPLASDDLAHLLGPA